MAPDHDHIHHRMKARMPTRQAVGVLYAVSAAFGLLAVLADSNRGGVVLIAVGCAGAVAAGLLIRLGYVRLPYAPPTLQPIEMPEGDRLGPGPAVEPAVDGEVPGGPEVSGDGARPPEDASSLRPTLSDQAVYR